jgi:hypothetical protein
MVWLDRIPCMILILPTLSLRSFVEELSAYVAQRIKSGLVSVVELASMFTRIGGIPFPLLGGSDRIGTALDEEGFLTTGLSVSKEVVAIRRMPCTGAIFTKIAA